MDGSVSEEIVIGSTFIDFIGQVDVEMFMVWMDNFTSNDDLWCQWNWVLYEESDPISVKAGVLFSDLNLVQNVGWVLSGIGDIVELVQDENTIESLHSLIHWFWTIPLPFSPGIDFIFP